jgi:hypothetical protein
MLQQLNPSVRYGKDSTITSNAACMSTGMDQGLHNWVVRTRIYTYFICYLALFKPYKYNKVYSGALQRFMDVKIFQQGEGPVNTVRESFYMTSYCMKPSYTYTIHRWGHFSELVRY